MNWSTEERQILETLDKLVSDPSIARALDLIASRAVENLHRDSSASLTWDIVPLHLYKEKLPSIIRSSWIFVLRAGSDTAAELHRHPNSHQRMMSWQGNGDLQVKYSNQWESNLLLSDPHAALERRWVSIPVNVWHQVVVAETDWIVVSFHTTPADELIEERPDDAEQGKTTQRLYLSL